MNCIQAIAFIFSGERGIRTPGPFGSTVFKTASLNRSDISPRQKYILIHIFQKIKTIAVFLKKVHPVKHLSAVHKYFWKYRYRFLIGIFFVVASNYFAVLAPEITGYVVNMVQQHLPGAKNIHTNESYNAVVDFFVGWVETMDFGKLVLICSLTILLLALLRGFFMFMMRQTLIVMSRHIEY